MRIVVFDELRVGVVDGAGIRDLTDLLPEVPSFAAHLRVAELIRRFETLRPEIDARLRGPGLPLERVRLGPPCPAPRNFLAAPLNYVAHGEELASVFASGAQTARELGFFVKATGSISGPSDPIELPPLEGRRFDHEAEIGVVIGRRTRGVSRADALDHVFGYTLVIDATLRMSEVEREERPMRKSYATFGPVGPWIVTVDEIPDPSILDVRLWVNGELRQEGWLSDLIVDVPDLIARASSVLELEPGDLYATGTPAGIGPIEAGDTVAIESRAIGRMELQVVSRQW